jgi:hypothetical protein
MITLKPPFTLWLHIAALLGLLLAASGCSSQDESAIETQLSVLMTAQQELLGTVASLETIQAYQSTQIGASSAAGDVHAPLVTTPAPQAVIITLTPSPTPYTPVYGSVVVEDGICCAGGQAGDEIEISVAFEAYSTGGEVVEMRLVTAFSRPAESRLLEEAWVPFQSEMTFSTRLAVNWVGWWVAVQYRDDLGNLSPIYYDDISLEGN